MAIDFPSSPVDGQVYTAGSRSWTWSNTGGFWQASSTTIGYTGSAGYSGSNGYTGSAGIGYTGSQGPAGGYTGSAGTIGYTGSAGTGGGGGASVTISDSAPGTPSAGNLWYNSAVGETYIYYNDGDSSQWVTVSAGLPQSVTATDALSQQFTADGTQTTFTLSRSVASQNNIIVSVNGLVQAPVLHYTISATTLSFTFTPPNGTLVEIRNLENGAGGSTTVNIYDTTTTSTGFFALPAGNTTQRPATPANGYMRYNITTGFGEIYTPTGWSIIGQGPPTISTVTPSTYNGESGTLFSIQGTNFTADATIKFISNTGVEYTAGTVTFINTSEIQATTPQDFTIADEPLDVKLVQNSGQVTKLDAIDCGGVPSWTTAAGSLGTFFDNGVTVNTAVIATDPDSGATVTYSIASGTLPSGVSLNATSGAITGTTPSISADTTYNFTINAIDNANNITARAFSMLIQVSNYFGSGSDGAGSF